MNQITLIQLAFTVAFLQDSLTTAAIFPAKSDRLYDEYPLEGTDGHFLVAFLFMEKVLQY